MPVAVADQALHNLVSALTPTTIEQVIELMQQSTTAFPTTSASSGSIAPTSPSLNKLICNQLPTGMTPSWLINLDVVFAGFYFRALLGFLSCGTGVPSSWTAMFEARYRTGVDRIQFALAGMNAHINHDLALALLAVDEQTGVAPSPTSPQHVDY